MVLGDGDDAFVDDDDADASDYALWVLMCHLNSAIDCKFAVDCVGYALDSSADFALYSLALMAVADKYRQSYFHIYHTCM